MPVAFAHLLQVSTVWQLVRDSSQRQRHAARRADFSGSGVARPTKSGDHAGIGRGGTGSIPDALNAVMREVGCHLTATARAHWPTKGAQPRAPVHTKWLTCGKPQS